jgi:ubiquinone/menaquinone biosynthesis C-methylase UbiE
MKNDEKIELSSVRKRFNEIKEIWNENDKWHNYTKQEIQAFLDDNISAIALDSNARFLNAGSAGNNYGINTAEHYHADIAELKLNRIDKSVVTNIEEMPFKDHTFDYCLCVGSVINYCDAARVIVEFQRLLKAGGRLFLEFENSRSLEYIFQPTLNQNAAIIKTFYQESQERIWVYSEKYIASLLRASQFRIVGIRRFHILSPLVYRMSKDSDFAASFGQIDPWARFVPFVNRFCSNIILVCEKTV